MFLPSQFLNGIQFLFCDRKFSDRSKRLFVVQIPQVIVYRENAEHIRLTAFCWRCDEVEMRGTCLEAQESIQSKVVSNSWKFHYDTEDTITKYRRKEFSDIRRNKKFYHRHSAKKCTKYPFDSEAHLKTVRRLWLPTSDRLETWLIPSGSIRSKQYHESTMVSRTDLFWYWNKLKKSTYREKNLPDYFFGVFTLNHFGLKKLSRTVAN